MFSSILTKKSKVDSQFRDIVKKEVMGCHDYVCPERHIV